ncbi:MAG: DsbA family protein [Gammaproteobacteria bacterium]|nr:DsbA family protein [Gammaproteobacteria bacterium]
MNTLYYVHDPMCSWCWGFRPVWAELRAALPPDIAVRNVLGGLAPDTSEPMPDWQKETLQNTWRRIQEHIPGTRFNFEFWTRCKPRRTTYPACRAVIAARNQRPEAEDEMILAIQHAYYLEARNPADDETLIELAVELGLEGFRFAQDLNAADTRGALARDFALRDRLGASSFPSLVFENGDRRVPIDLDYTRSDKMLTRIQAARAAA